MKPVDQTASRPLVVSLLISLLLFVAIFPFNVSLVSSLAKQLPERKDTASVSTLTAEGRLAVFDDAWQTIYDRYYDPHFRGIDWEGQRAVYRPRAAEAANGQELYLVLRRLIAGLNDVHTRIYPPEEKFAWWNPRFISIGLTVREIDGLPTVVQVEKNSEPARAGIRPGDLIEAVDGAS
ncbi:MAG: hypothetical protein ACRD6N_10510, partial [Pyrinomonadaceae bacterium]